MTGSRLQIRSIFAEAHSFKMELVVITLKVHPAAPQHCPSIQAACDFSRPDARAGYLIGPLLVLLACFAQVARAQDKHKQDWVAFSRAGAPSRPLQCFSPSNVSVCGGDLILFTRAESTTCSSFDLATATYKYTSGFVAMRTFSFLYGTVEFRAKFGGGSRSGAWPVVWMADVSCQASDPNGADNRCNGQEIDIAEILHGDFKHVNQQIHVDNFTHDDGCDPRTSDTSTACFKNGFGLKLSTYE
jgi:beta-glucanase (GH16 family)